MTVKELYEKIGGDYDEALKRLSMDMLVGRFILRFLDDPSCKSLLSAWEHQDETELFEAAHSAKGVCANLALTRLADIAGVITEATRPGNETAKSGIDIAPLVDEFRKVYDNTVTEITLFASQQ